MTQVLVQLATHSAALLVYPGLLMAAIFGTAVEIVWVRISEHHWVLPEVRWHRPSALLATVAIASMLASVQTSAPFNLVPSEERNLIVATIALGLAAWVELALGIELFGEPGLLLLVQCCWLVAVLVCTLATIARAVSAFSRSSAAFACAAAFLTMMVAVMRSECARSPLIGKFSTARAVWTP